MADPSDLISVQRARISRLMDVLSLAAIGAFEHEKCVIDIEHQDDFALLEQTLNLFTEELSNARAENEQHVKELLSSRQDLEEKLRTIEAQQEAIRQLSNPILEIWDRVIVLPVIGNIDAQRATEMTEALLVSVVRLAADSVIIDATGAAAFDTATADHFQRMVRAAELLGAFCVLTGISPENARSLTSLDIDFRNIPTLGTLKLGLEACIEHQRKRQARYARGNKSDKAAPSQAAPVGRRIQRAEPSGSSRG
jgi:rsbT co-antagonist protein RsbR